MSTTRHHSLSSCSSPPASLSRWLPRVVWSLPAAERMGQTAGAIARRPVPTVEPADGRPRSGGSASRSTRCWVRSKSPSPRTVGVRACAGSWRVHELRTADVDSRMRSCSAAAQHRPDGPPRQCGASKRPPRMGVLVDDLFCCPARPGPSARARPSTWPTRRRRGRRPAPLRERPVSYEASAPW